MQPTQNTLSVNRKLIPGLKRGITIVIILYMINNLEHSTAVYYSVSKKKLTEIFAWQYADWLESVLVIVVIDLSVIVWIRMNRYWEAGVFAFLIVLINLLYYQWPGTFSQETNKRIAELLFSAMFGFGLISFSYLSSKLNELELANLELPNQQILKISELESDFKLLQSEKQEIESLCDKLSLEKREIQSENERLSIALAEAGEIFYQKSELEKELELIKVKDESSRTCEYCSEILDSVDSKRVHKGQCARNPKNMEKRNPEVLANDGLQ